MIRRRLLAFALSAAAIATAAVLLIRKQESPRPNIVFILIDALRADHLGAWGYDRATSPNIDALADRSVLFENAASQSTWTFGSVPSFLTSRYAQSLKPATHHVRVAPIAPFPPGVKTFPERLHAAGYRTTVISNHQGLPRITGLDAGFDKTVWLRDDDSRVALAALDELADAEEPFFLWVYFFGTHAPYASPEPYQSRFSNDGKHVTGRLLGPAARVGVPGTIPPNAQLGGHRDVDYYVAAYDGKIAWIDRLVGDITAALTERGLDETTAIVVTSDHGELMGEEEQFFSHGGALAWGGIHVPLLFALPGGVHAGTRVRGAVGLIDLAPTLLEIAGADADPEASGRSLLPCFDEPERCDDGLAFTWAARAQQTSVTDGRWLLRCARQDCSLLDTTTGESANRDRVAQHLRRSHDEWLHLHPPPSAQPRPVDRQTRETLRELGYIDR